MSKKRKNEFSRIDELMKDVLQENSLQKGMDFVAVKDAWVAVMGPGVSSYTTELRLHNTTLFVKLSSSVLREELSYGNEKIIKMLNAKLNKVLIKSVKLL